MKALERIAKTYDGWCPIIDDLHMYTEEVTTLCRMTREAGRNPDTLQFSLFIDRQKGNLSRDALKALQDTGVTRVVLFT